jgi:hypothetical protein
MTSITSRRPHDLIWPSHLPAGEALLALREGRLTGWNDAGPLSPRFWIDKLKCDVAMGVWKVSRAEARRVWPHYFEEADERPFATVPGLQIMPDAQAKRLKLLWDFADEMAQLSGNTPEWHLVELIRDFLRGDFASSGIVYFYPTHDPADPQACQLYREPDSFREKMELQAGIPDLTIEGLLHWSWRDYEKLPELKETRRQKEYFVERDPHRQFGLFVRRDECEAWRARASAHDGASETAPSVSEQQPPHSSEAPSPKDKALEAALDEFVRDTWGPNFVDLPGTDDLLPRLRTEFPNSAVNREHAAALRRKYATREVLGTAPTMRPQEVAEILKELGRMPANRAWPAVKAKAEAVGKRVTRDQVRTSLDDLGWKLKFGRPKSLRSSTPN